MNLREASEKTFRRSNNREADDELTPLVESARNDAGQAGLIDVVLALRSFAGARYTAVA